MAHWDLKKEKEKEGRFLGANFLPGKQLYVENGMLFLS